MGRNIETVHFPDTAPKLKRVAAYARVSSGKDAMLHSLSAQISEYSSRIRKHQQELQTTCASACRKGCWVYSDCRSFS